MAGSRVGSVLWSSQLSQATGSRGEEGGVKKKKETITQHCNITPARAEAEAGLIVSSLL